MSKKSIITIGVVMTLVAFVFVVASQATKPKVDGKVVTKVFSQGEPCQTARIPLNLASSSDPSEVSERLFAALQPVKGLNTASVDVGAASIEVGFCESSANEDMIRQALLPTGLVAEGPATSSEIVE